MADGKRSIVVISDTHLGLMPRRRDLLPNTVKCRPETLCSFLSWVAELERAEKRETRGKKTRCERVRKYKIKLAPDEEKELIPPSALILLGDIIELWDASDRSIEFCSRSFHNALSRLRCEKIYVLGNHDDILQSEGWDSLPSGESSLTIINERYPEDSTNPGRCFSEEIGGKRYIFLHGHQFDTLFGPLKELKVWRALAYLREGAEAFRSFSWLFFALFVLFSALHVLKGLNVIYADAGGAYTLPVLIVMLILAVPRIATSFARPLFDKLTGSRYKKTKAVKGFYSYWCNLTRGLQAPDHVYVVYGHTHLVESIEPGEVEDLVDRSDWSVKATLLNVPAWTEDTAHNRPEREPVTYAIALYIDEEGHYFIGWDSTDKRPFYIDDNLIRQRSEGKCLTNEQEENLRELGWPENLIEKWRNPRPHASGPTTIGFWTPEDARTVISIMVAVFACLAVILEIAVPEWLGNAFLIIMTLLFTSKVHDRIRGRRQDG